MWITIFKIFWNSKQSFVGVYFPVDQDAEEELRKLANHTVNYVQLAVDTLNEAIKLECSKTSISPEDLNEVIQFTMLATYKMFIDVYHFHYSKKW